MSRTTKNFTHLHMHSHYSLLDGLGKIPEIIGKAKELNMEAVAITDHGNLYGAIEFYQQSTDAGIKPIIGMEGYIAPNKRTQKRAGIDNNPYHVIFLAYNNIGYQNLIKISSDAWTKGYYYKPRTDYDVLREHSEGIIALSGCVNGHLAREILAGNLDNARNVVKMYQEIFGEENYFFEIQDFELLDKQVTTNAQLIEWSEELSVPLVATNDTHYVNKDDVDAHDVLLCIQTNKTVHDTNRMDLRDTDLSFRSREEMEKAFSHVPQALDNTMLIAERANIEIDLGSTHLPSYEIPKEKTYDEVLEEMCLDAFEERYDFRPADLKKETIATIQDPLQKERAERLEFELSTIARMGYSSYFLIVQDFVNWAKDQGMMVGPGRGSAAGSLVSYLTNITSLDPIEYGLLFERFLNPDRVSMPDIDIDFPDDRRDEVLRYVESKYGKDHVAQIITFGTMAAKAAVRDAGRALGFPYGFCDTISKLIPMFTGLQDAVNEVPELKEMYDKDPDAKAVIDTALKLEGCCRHASVHACGVVITKDPLDSYTPYQYINNDDTAVISQYSLHPIEDLGLLKMDFLGLKNLTVIQNACKIIKRVHGVELDPENLPLDDPKTFDLFQAGETIGVFQVESAGMQRYLKQLKPTQLSDIIAMVALYRPGPMEFIPDFIAGKHGTKKITYTHENLRPVLEETYGVAVFQEQVMQIARELAGFTPGEADTLRKAMGKKIKELMDEQKVKFIEGCMEHSKLDKATAKKVWAQIEPFAQYGFNRAHSACYGYIGYITAYLKANYPAEYMAALLTADQGNTDRVTIETAECKRMGIDILPPSASESFHDFTVVDHPEDPEKQAIRFGLAAIKNVGDGIIEAIITERETNGEFESLDDFVTRVKSKDLNKKSFESLTKCGALDFLGERGQLLGNMEDILRHAKEIQKAEAAGQESLFAGLDAEAAGAGAPTFRLKPSAEASREEKLSWEKELLGLYVSEHPMSVFEEALRDKVSLCTDLKDLEDKTKVRVAGAIAEVKKILTKKGDRMAFVTIEDLAGNTELIVFPKALEKYDQMIEAGGTIIAQGTVSHKDDSPKILLDNLKPLREEHLETIKKLGPLKSKRKPQALAPAPDAPMGLRPLENPALREPGRSIPQPQHQSTNLKQTLTDLAKDLPANAALVYLPESITKTNLAQLKTMLESAEAGDKEIHLAIPIKGKHQRVKTPYSLKLSNELATQIKTELANPNIVICAPKKRATMPPSTPAPRPA